MMEPSCRWFTLTSSYPCCFNIKQKYSRATLPKVMETSWWIFENGHVQQILNVATFTFWEKHRITTMISSCTWWICSQLTPSCAKWSFPYLICVQCWSTYMVFVQINKCSIIGNSRKQWQHHRWTILSTSNTTTCQWNASRNQTYLKITICMEIVYLTISLPSTILCCQPKSIKLMNKFFSGIFKNVQNGHPFYITLSKRKKSKNSL